MSENIINIIQFILAIYGILLIIFGTASNLISFWICSRIKKNPTFIFLSYLSVANIFCIYHWNADYIMRYLFGIDWLNLNLLVCKLFNFIQYSSSQSAAWILVNFYLIWLINLGNIFFHWIYRLKFRN